ncbi:succinylglutamate desuccinylase/aspartoacylase family protein, partial [candidate division KSB1 bacterium]|nr:succinylglutamate desuccinylase/aspartoacylase family protein [candidate division KSB1 bacterium]
MDVYRSQAPNSFIFTILVYFCFSIPLFASDETLLTRAEKSNYTETTRYDEIILFIKKLQKRSSKIKVTSIGKSTEGREIPLVILGDPVPASPAQMFLQNKPAIYVQANIHAGEVEGKEAVLMLMREILTGSLSNLLENQVIFITPIFNPDGNEKISVQNRTRQHGPTGGVGKRYNGQNLDLNRDYIKIESPENGGAFEFILSHWDPILLIDL